MGTINYGNNEYINIGFNNDFFDKIGMVEYSPVWSTGYSTPKEKGNANTAAILCR